MLGKSIITIVCVVIFSLPAFPQTKTGKKDRINIEYVEALSVADQFLTAWQ